VARLEAILRRPSQLIGSSIQLGNLVFDTASRQVFIDDKPQQLSARETAVLELLIRRKGHVVSKRHIEDELFGLFTEIASNAIEVYVHRLRKQLIEHGAALQIHTVRGVGYILAEAGR
jgi:DNA-binding response OmpR family regulator